MYRKLELILGNVFTWAPLCKTSEKIK